MDALAFIFLWTCFWAAVGFCFGWTSCTLPVIRFSRTRRPTQEIVR